MTQEAMQNLPLIFGNFCQDSNLFVAIEECKTKENGEQQIWSDSR